MLPDHRSRPPGGPAGQVILFQQQNPASACCSRVHGDAGTDDPATDYHYVR